MTQPPPPPGWYPDPAAGTGTRWWDGHGWTDHVQQAAPSPPAGYGSGSPLYEQPVLLVNQQTKLMEVTNEYAVLDGQGRQIGAVAQIGQSGLRKAVRFVSSVDQFLTHHLEVRDARGPVLVLTRPAKFLKSRVLVQRPDGAPVGEIVQAKVFGRIRFDLLANGRLIGASRPRTGGRGTSRSPMPPVSRSPGSPRSGRGWRGRCSPPPTATSSWCTTGCRSRWPAW